ncbi:MAG: hypothetical protein H6666_11305 [Ardenticatenaceae bacterium]|nr:hypothetical protein [Anaerolineales bacterium]MCB8918498.1 hypothetical protein [Ardenticatenaceae bacterium]
MDIEEANRAIKNAWVAGLIAGGINVLLTLIYASGGNLLRVDWWNWVDLPLMFLLSFGVYKKNRASAIILLIYYIGSKTYFWWNERAFIGVPIALIFAYFLLGGVRGTLAYHKLQNATPAGEH